MTSLDIRVRYVGLIRRLVTVPDEVVSVPSSATLRDLLEAIAARHQLDLEDTLFSGDGLGPLVTVLVDGVNCHSHGELEMSLSGRGDVEIVLMGPPAMGG